jgi:hypothetical protein
MSDALIFTLSIVGFIGGLIGIAAWLADVSDPVRCECGGEIILDGWKRVYCKKCGEVVKV